MAADGPPRMGKRPTGSGGEPSSPNCGASAGGKARQLPFQKSKQINDLGDLSDLSGCAVSLACVTSVDGVDMDFVAGPEPAGQSLVPEDHHSGRPARGVPQVTREPGTEHVRRKEAVLRATIERAAWLAQFKLKRRGQYAYSLKRFDPAPAAPVAETVRVSMPPGAHVPIRSASTHENLHN